jgi:glycosyltransferase involved in cell wall biosynthesis
MGVTARIEGVRHLIRRGHDVTLITGAARSDRAIPGVPTIFVHTRHVPFVAWILLWPKVRGVLRRLDTVPDVIVSDFVLLPAVMRYLRWLRKAGRSVPRVVLDVRSHPVEAGRFRLAAQRARFAWTLGRYGRKVDALTTISAGLREHVSSLTRVDARDITIWTTGCAWCDREIPVPPAPPEWPASLRDRVVFFYHGAMTSGRGLFEAIHAIEIARRDAPEIALVLLGGGVARPKLEGLARRLGLGADVVFLDPVPLDRVPEFLSQADVGLAPWPATWDMEVNCPLKLTEYLCVGLPVVITDVKPHRIIPTDAPFAFWAPASTAEGLAHAMVQAARARSDLARMGTDARTWARPRLGWSMQFAILEETLDSVVSRGAAVPLS